MNCCGALLNFRVVGTSEHSRVPMCKRQINTRSLCNNLHSLVPTGERGRCTHVRSGAFRLLDWSAEKNTVFFEEIELKTIISAVSA